MVAALRRGGAKDVERMVSLRETFDFFAQRHAGARPLRIDPGHDAEWIHQGNLIREHVERLTQRDFRFGIVADTRRNANIRP
jgi:mannose/cellobiose epimerase-like protein (N-acyl-D-glucosamine 2-epimerase family)